MKNYILTGTPGSGKTTLINELAVRGFQTIPEAATDLIAKLQADGLTRPWERSVFIDEILELQIQRYHQYQADLRLFDRSPFCTYALALYLNHPITSEFIRTLDHIIDSNHYEKDVFFIDNLGQIEKTAARQISYEDALKFERLHLDVYQQFGFNCIRIKPGNINNRIQQIFREIGPLSMS